MFSIKKTEELNEVLNNLHSKEIGYTFTMDGDDYFICSCGASGKLKKISIETSQYDEKHDIRYTVYTCPECGNTTIVPYIDIMDDYIPIIFELETLQDDENFWISCLKGYNITIDINDTAEHMHIEEFEEDDWVLSYDKKKDLLFITARGYTDWWKHYDALEYRDGKAYCGDEEVTNLMETNDLYSSYYYNCNYDYPHQFDNCKRTGLLNVIETIMERCNIPTDSIIDYEVGFADMLNELLVVKNIKWFNDYEHLLEQGNTDNLNKFGLRRRDKVVSYYFEFSNLGVDMNAKTTTDAFQLPIHILKSLQYKDDYVEARKSYNKIKDYHLSEIHTTWLNDDVPYKLWGGVIKLSSEMNVPLETTITHIHRGVGNGFKAEVILNSYFTYMKKGLTSVIDLNSTFTNKTMRQWDLLINDKMTLEQYQSLSEKPTLDNFIKIFQV